MRGRWRRWLDGQAQKRQRANLHRWRQPWRSGELCFDNNDYLGLADHPRIKRAAILALEHGPVGSGASPLISGWRQAHSDLEQALAQFVGAERALLFGSGYSANLSLLGALLGRGDRLVADRLCHASIWDGALLGRARVQRFAHNDQGHALRLLADAGGGGRTLVATEALFSMDGDSAGLAALDDMAARHDALFLVDEAHSFGTTGPGGRGGLAAAGLAPGGHRLMMATLGKAMGVSGAFVAGDAALIEQLIQNARPYIYSTAPPPMLAAAALEALALLGRESWRRRHLQRNIAFMRRHAAQMGLPLRDSRSAIQPLVLGDAGRALAAADALGGLGIRVRAIRPPTVPPGSSRLRIALSARHSRADMQRLLDSLALACKDAA